MAAAGAPSRSPTPNPTGLPWALGWTSRSGGCSPRARSTTTSGRPASMTSHGIADKVAIVGMGCTRFGESWDSSVDDLLLEATTECLESLPGVAKDDVDAYWLGTLGSGQSGLTLSRALGTEDKPVTRVENYCATG